MKTNPYVGSFRHSPPTSFRSLEASEPSSRMSPYIGWFRHAPPSSIHLHKVDPKQLSLVDKCRQLAMILESLPPTPQDRPEFNEIINGRLLGGCKDAKLVNTTVDSTHIMKSVHDILQETSEESSSTTVKMLAKLGSWFLFPLAYDAESCGYRDGDNEKGFKLFPEDTSKQEESGYDSECESEEIDSDSDSGSDDGGSTSTTALSDYDSICRPVSSSCINGTDQKAPLNLSVSEIAQAYHAHQEFDQSEYSTYEGHRLDFVITQMDIARMARNASRHLDVDSILTLPTVTYRSPTCQGKKTEATADSRGAEEAWSFVMVQEDKPEESAQQVDTEENKNVCVICLDQFIDGDRLRVLPCDHFFHVGCIDRWLSGSHSHHECFTSGCPTCKERPGLHTQVSMDGSVPSWAFKNLGDALARSAISPSE